MDESISDMIKDLNDDEEDTSKDEELEVNAPEDEDENEEGEEGEENEEDENLEDDDKDNKNKDLDSKSEKIEIPQFKEINKKYPTLFKDFPHLRHAFFHTKEYREIFPTVEEAKEAVSELEGFKALEDSLTDGSPENIIKVLNSISELDDESLPNLATNFLSSIKKIDQDLYYSVITPELVNFTRTMYNAGVRNNNDDLKNSALQAALHYFGDPKVASGEKEVKLPTSGERKDNKKDDKLERERQTFKQERYNAFYNDVVSQSNDELTSAILEGIDPKKTMSAGMKELISDKVLKEITANLQKNSIYMNRINSLWKKANTDNFSSQHKTKIIATYLEAAKEIMPRIRTKVRNSVLGIRERRPENNGSHEREERIEPKGSSRSGQRSSSNGKGKIDSKMIDYRKTSDLDIMRGNITYKKD